MRPGIKRKAYTKELEREAAALKKRLAATSLDQLEIEGVLVARPYKYPTAKNYVQRVRSGDPSPCPTLKFEERGATISLKGEDVASLIKHLQWHLDNGKTVNIDIYADTEYDYDCELEFSGVPDSYRYEDVFDEGEFVNALSEYIMHATIYLAHHEKALEKAEKDRQNLLDKKERQEYERLKAKYG